MATSTLVPVEEYLKTMYHPDCDYVDGMLVERNLGETNHAWVQRNLVISFGSRYREAGITAIPELRFQTQPTRFRVPDVVVTRGKPDEQILTKPPLLCIEILSPEDRIPSVNTRIKEYLDFGVPVVWLIEPTERKIWIYRANGMEESTGESIKLDGTDIEVPFSEIFD
jgi:Uma2 family endonuclease